MGEIRVFINERAVTLPSGTTVAEAVSNLDPQLAPALRAGGAYVTDGVGRRIDPAAEVTAGAILRVIRSAPRVNRDQARS